MTEIGKINHLYVVKEVDFGIYLDGGDLGEILMPKRYVPEGTQPEDMIDAFIYLDSEDRLVATTGVKRLIMHILPLPVILMGKPPPFRR